MPSNLSSLWIISVLSLLGIFPAAAQTSGSRDHFPYAFSNFPWWSDPQLRAELKRRIPDLGNELARNSPIESNIRRALISLLKTKGIDANVQVREPDLDYLKQERVPEAPPVAIVFSIVPPPFIAIDTVKLDGAPALAMDTVEKAVQIRQGSFYSTQNFWSIQDLIDEALQESGFLISKCALEPGLPTKNGQDFKVPITAHIIPGPQFHVATIKTSGGPLFANRDLSSYYTVKPGDVAIPNPFGHLADTLSSGYRHAGYPDVEIHGDPALDPVHALASYNLTVDAGPLYHLRSLTILHLDDAQRSTVTNILGLQPGGVFDGTATTALYRKISGPSSPLSGYKFTYSSKEDKTAHVVDLTIDFYRGP